VVLVAEYTGYDRAPTQCVSRVAHPRSPGVGILVYHELHYRKQGTDSSEANASPPQVVERVEVTEVFRYDGARSMY
jgi:hypothetical protein